MRKISLSSLILIVLLISFASATIETLGVFKQNSAINLIQSCSNCTSVNITSVIYPNSTRVIGLVQMQKVGTMYNYTLTQNYSSLNGEYIVNCVGDPNGVVTACAYTFNVNPIGKTTSVQEGMIYVLTLIVLFVLLMITIYGGYKLPSENIRANEDNLVLKVEWKKYLKWFCWGLTYINVIWIVYICWNLSYAYLSFDTMANIFRVLWYLLLALSMPIMIIGIIYGVINYVRDLKIQEMLERGLTVR